MGGYLKKEWEYYGNKDNSFIVESNNQPKGEIIIRDQTGMKTGYYKFSNYKELTWSLKSLAEKHSINILIILKNILGK